jgi:hypothetical protein
VAEAIFAAEKSAVAKALQLASMPSSVMAFAESAERMGRIFGSAGRDAARPPRPRPPVIEVAPVARAGDAARPVRRQREQPNRRSRAGVGGPKKHYADAFVIAIARAHDRAMKQVEKGLYPMEPFPEWLRLHCKHNDIDAALFLRADDSEPWDKVANKFLRTARKRLRKLGLKLTL